jgi:hypothetical protein
VSDMPRSHRMVASQLIRSGDYERPYTSFVAAAREDPSNWYAWYGAGVRRRLVRQPGGNQRTVLEPMGRRDEAESCLAEARAFLPAPGSNVRHRLVCP